MNPEDLIQGTPEWHSYRCGKVTASGIVDLMARSKTTGDWLASRANYMAEKVCERLSGVPVEKYVSPAMKWGTDCEPMARSAYSLLYDVDVRQIGFADHPTIPLAGCSPDGLIGEDGLVEFKCPNTATHIQTLLTAKIDSAYIVQMQWQMACRPERKWCDFVSYDPRLVPRLQLFTKRVFRDAAKIVDYERHVIDFQIELDAQIAALNKLYPDPEREAA